MVVVVIEGNSLGLGVAAKDPIPCGGGRGLGELPRAVANLATTASAAAAVATRLRGDEATSDDRSIATLALGQGGSKLGLDLGQPMGYPE